MIAKTTLLILTAVLAGACGGAASLAPEPHGTAPARGGTLVTFEPSLVPAASVEPSMRPASTITPSPARTPSAEPTQAAAPATSQVNIAGFAYAPPRLTVPGGTTVRWINQDQSRHTVTSGPSDEPDGHFASEIMAMGQSFEVTFSEAGSYEYFCDLHPRMTAVIEVRP